MKNLAAIFALNATLVAGAVMAQDKPVPKQPDQAADFLTSYKGDENKKIEIIRSQTEETCRLDIGLHVEEPIDILVEADALAKNGEQPIKENLQDIMALEKNALVNSVHIALQKKQDDRLAEDIAITLNDELTEGLAKINAKSSYSFYFIMSARPILTRGPHACDAPTPLPPPAHLTTSLTT